MLWWIKNAGKFYQGLKDEAFHYVTLRKQAQGGWEGTQTQIICIFCILPSTQILLIKTSYLLQIIIKMLFQQ